MGTRRELAAPLAGFKGPTSKGSEGRGREWEVLRGIRGIGGAGEEEWGSNTYYFQLGQNLPRAGPRLALPAVTQA